MWMQYFVCYLRYLEHSLQLAHMPQRFYIILYQTQVDSINPMPSNTVPVCSTKVLIYCIFHLSTTSRGNLVTI